MNPKTYINGVQNSKKNQDPPLWKFKGLKLTTETQKTYSMTDFINVTAPELTDSVLGPGAGAGVGCGAGFGLGLVGGMGFGGSAWNHLRVAFGFGIGCGVGVGFGYGQGFGYGSRWETLKARIVRPGPGSKKRILIQI
uniref:glycine-rich protein 5 n=1 Tax=Erigeron canadensis TaxID=72917 RepID=UPI001CB9B7A1|nr:glycine-rich protein 5 [Erigeron canadensis]